MIDKDVFLIFDMEMVFMRKMISFLLVVVVLLSLALPVCATVASAGQSGTPAVTPSGKVNPKTGDMIMMWVVIMLVALLALAAVVFCYRKFAK